jgi:hypothetical protein
MKRFFFDYRTHDKSLLDYRGHEFHSCKSAIDFAQEIALGLKHSLTENWAGWSVEVRSAEGEKFYTQPIKVHALLAA